MLDGQLLAQLLIVFAVVALLALVLRWTFDRRSSTSVWPAAPDPPTGERGGGDDFGLLGAAATVESEDEAQRIRDVLGVAGIKATTAVDATGRWRVLVFSSELLRARRVAGGSS